MIENSFSKQKYPQALEGMCNGMLQMEDYKRKI